MIWLRWNLRTALTSLMACILLVILVRWVAPVFAQGDPLVVSTTEGMVILDTLRGLQVPFLATRALPIWSPDGAWVASVSQTRANDTLTISDERGQVFTQLYPPIGRMGSMRSLPVWSPDSQQLAFFFEDAGDETMRFVRVSRQNQTYDETIVFMSFSSITVRWQDLDTLEAVFTWGDRVYLAMMQAPNWQPTTQQTWDFDTTMTRPVAFSPDGTVFILPAITPSDLSYDLYRFEVGQTEFTNITQRYSHNETAPIWSNDGRFIAYKASSEGGQYLYMADADGNNARIITSVADGFLGDFGWSPDNTRIAFSSGTPNNYYVCIYVLADERQACPVGGQSIDGISWRPMH